MNDINKDFLLNDEISAKEVRVVSNDGGRVGIVPLGKALKLAEEKELDLVMISPRANPPVCKIMNYGKFIYEQSKREKEAKKKQKIINIKEVRLSPTIEEHDISIKAKNAEKFLLTGDKVKVTIRFRGREAGYSFIGKKILDNFYSKLEGISVIEKQPKLEGRNMIMTLSAKKA
ncbi:translation initiation factor IF-3 [Clostridium luticellarii]|uniref:Translation initiation factor IF-3 n=1 Tax=Clostridium luticellarii TaxID=1691940 RepID=A0A2T0BQW6_9CLOT|nr:translation initiation factor IF-3 [Clostridium luticellarii]MCI1946294.1 translation initiation factor IF-3 [Clostridium luticellarii]MCI1969513.1 translation initiation factor IF-3 [Clostridium luticellarii]MCI1996690.1 translation initiation factor IF-3 [Clostridium luticellarii]MCI2041217.1 translation initiation factor IF-3 [Clostridium luticellarii]PRR86256.1 Translation initiation factor IF-3 [Clostridium luticellarii]